MRVFDVTLYPSTINYYSFSRFIEGNFTKIVQFIKNSPSGNMVVRVKKSLLDFNRKEQSDYVAMELHLSIQGDELEGEGMLRTDEYEYKDPISNDFVRVTKGWPLFYKFKGQMVSDGLDISQLIIKSDSHYAKLWGNVRGGDLAVNGFAFMDTTKYNSEYLSRSTTLFSNKISSDNELINTDVFMLDIDAKMKLTFPNIDISYLNFSMNNYPVTLKGNISLRHPLTLNADLSIFKPSSTGNRGISFEKVTMQLVSQWQKYKITTDGKINFEFDNQRVVGFSPESVHIDFNDLVYRHGTKRRSSVQLKNCKIAYWINDNEHKILIRNYKAKTTMQKDGLKSIVFNALFYDGLLNGEVWVDVTQSPAKITSQFELNDIDTATLEELFGHVAKFNGRMSTSMSFTNTPQAHLDGNISIKDGKMTDFDFFNWVGDA